MVENPLVKFRRERSLTQSDTSILFDVHATHISRCETGHVRPSRHLLERLREHGVDLRTFINEWRDFVAEKRAAIARRVTHADRPEEPAAALEVKA